MKVFNARRRPLALAAALASVTLALSLSGAPAQAAPAPQPAAKQAAVYVALGDSYAAGTGGGATVQSPYLPFQCLQTAKAYPALLGGTNLGCFGATTADVRFIASSFAPLLAPATEVTITAGGNDAGVGNVTAVCVPDPAGLACAAAVAAAQAALPAVPGNVAAMVAHVRPLAPNADIVLTGYPRLFTITSAMPPAQRALATTLNGMADQLNAAVKAGADAAGVPFVDVTNRFKGHGVGSDTPWINFDGTPFNPDNFHPNAAGYTNGYRPAVDTAVKR
ncbi:SGNH/GDSL hydrolase family protein [Arthrobacter sp. CJ23]|uniref:SGNH/GDSL hydrolase family protein n=1 Tax=Arthrobacter sp. CJ23 TaxID=2972479 RepID=UPI00215B9D52|nr:SGNH/GDSL hydrolase family protein [Arthrobacter sp. CJ23]UVJ38781.1 SGNH/GDSL hydrolase family protein [Arthrobacter sp. CJ23]